MTSLENEFDFIGRGSYGCVIKPKKTKTIIKLFDNEETYKKELDENKIILEIDPTSDFTVKLEGHKEIASINDAEFDSSKNNIKEIINKNCNELFPSNFSSKVFEIEYEYGGIDLFDLFQDTKNEEILKKINLYKFFKGFGKIFEGIKKINKKNYTHFDIKHNNIVFNKETYKFSLIDFGLLINTEEIYHENQLPYNEYVFYPPEYTIISYFYFKDSKKPQEIYNEKFLLYKTIILMELDIKCQTNSQYTKIIDIFFTKFKELIEPTNKSFEQLKKIFEKIEDLSSIYLDKKNQTEIIREYTEKYQDENYLFNSKEILLSHYIDNLCTSINAASSNIKNKFDVFMLGNVLLYLIIKISCSNYVNLQTIDILIIKKMLKLVLFMIHPNPCLRYSSEQAYSAYISFFH